LIDHYEQHARAALAAREEERKRQEELRKAADVKRIEDERRAREAALAEARLRAQQVKDVPEVRRVEEQERAEHASRAEELRKALEEARLAKEEAKAAEEQRLAAIRAAEEGRKAAQAAIAAAEDQIYDGIIAPKGTLSTRKKMTSQHLLEFIVYQKCNVDKLSPKDIAKLRGEREPLDRLRSELKAIADGFREMRDAAAYEKTLRAEVNGVLTRWRNEKANLSTFAKAVFGGSGGFCKNP
jgi:hypothetical protein